MYRDYHDDVEHTNYQHLTNKDESQTNESDTSETEQEIDGSEKQEGQTVNNTTRENNSTPKQEPNKPKRWTGFLGMVAAAILGSVLTLGAVTQLDFFQPEGSDGDVPAHDATQVHTDQSEDNNAKPVATDGSVADIVDHASDAIVGIVNMTDRQQNPFTQPNAEEDSNNGEVEKGVGSGVIYKVSKDGAYIATNNHVIEDASSLQVSLSNGDTVDGELVGTDPLTDIAVVKIKGDYDMKPIKFGDSDALRTGDSVIAIGNPLGLDLSNTVTQGIVSATERSIPVQTSAGEWEFNVIQTDAAINPGNSGGALLNNNGELVGINTLKIGNNGVEGLGFSIPSNEVTEIIDELVDNGKVVRPYAGVGIKSISEIPPYYLHKLPEDVKEGAVVLSVDEKSAAAKAGIEVEDVIVGINGEDIKSDKDFRSYLYKNTEIGDVVKVELYHEGEKKTVEVKLTSNADVQ